MNIKEAKNEIKNTVQAYLKKDEMGDYKIPSVRQRPILLMGPPGIGKTQVMEQVANQVKAVLEEESGVQTEVMLFSSNYGLMARTAGADAYVRELLEMERGMEVMIDRRIINYEKSRFEY